VIGLGFVYLLLGALTAAAAAVNAADRAHPRRWPNALFWGLWSLTFLAGPRLGERGAGAVVVLLALLAAAGGRAGREAGTAPVAGGDMPAAAPAPRDGAQESPRGGPAPRGRAAGHALFAPALLVPAVTALGAWLLPRLRVGGAPLVDPRQGTLVALGLGALAGLALALALLRPGAAAPAREARRLLDAVGWAAVLPQALAALGAVFAAAGVGRAVAALLGRWLPLGVPLVAAATYTTGMALLTVLMGNAFAAFPLMTAAVGLPVLVARLGGDPAAVTAVGMLSGFCGTLLTPMAANFNVVPAALLELGDDWAVIRAQAPTALVLLAFNTALMYALVAPR
jgi:uncharacterized membrane protein